MVNSLKETVDLSMVPQLKSKFSQLLMVVVLQKVTNGQIAVSHVASELLPRVMRAEIAMVSNS